MQAPTSIKPVHQTASEIISGLMSREEQSWTWTSSGSDPYPTNPVALHYTLNLNEFRMREIDNIVVLGLRGLGTVEQLHANLDNQGLSADQRHTQNVAITQLDMARVIRGHIQGILRNHSAVNLYVCDHGLAENIAPALQRLGFTVLRPDELSRQINQNTLVYDVTMHAAGLHEAVNFSPGQNMAPPAAVITHFNSLMRSNRAVDTFRSRSSVDSLSDLLENYWLSPLMDFTPSVIVPEEAARDMASGPGPDLTYKDWVDMQEEHSLNVQQGYLEESAEHHRQMAKFLGLLAEGSIAEQIPHYGEPLPGSWISDPLMVMLCRKHHAGPTLFVDGPQPHEPLPQQRRAEHHQGEETWGESELWEAHGHGGPSDVSYAPMPEQYDHGVHGGHDDGPGHYLNVPPDDRWHGTQPGGGPY